MMKVLVFGMTENPGGVESVIMNYYRKIDKEKMQFDFLCNCRNVSYKDEINSFGGRIYSITSRRENFFLFKRELDMFMKEHASEYDVIWVNLCSLVNIDYLISAKKYGVRKRIIHCHNSDNDAGKIKGLIHEFNRKRIKRYATDFWSCSSDASKWFFEKEIIDGNNYKVLPNAIDINRFKQDVKIRQAVRTELGIKDKKVVGHVGRFHFQKNHKYLINIFEKLIQTDKNYHLLLVGQGELEDEIRELVNDKSLEKYVTFCGVHNDVEKYYQAMDVFVLPSVFEGLAVVTLEAQANGLSCIFSCALPKIVKVNRNVSFLDLDEDTSQWESAIVQGMKAGRLSDAENCMEKSIFNINVQVNEFERWLQE